MRMLVFISLFVSACSSPSPEVLPTPPDVPVAAVSADFAYTVGHYEQLGSAPPVGPAVLSALSHHGDIRLTLSNLGHYCAPMPSFTMQRQEHDLVLTLIRPDVVSRCVGAHDMELSFAGIDMESPLIDQVVILDWDGDEVITTGVARAR